ncbi:MAG TPA: permease prefix domain 1-containing protein [Proteiniclasticum sp.]|nr:permease prefix domain 1-containing protein [Proteiniclasticum sp.]
MSWQGKEAYLREVLSQVKFSYDHEPIYKELTSHLEERVEEYLSQGYEKEEAEEMALENFGNPVEIGKALNKEHSPLLGWVHFLSSTMAAIAMGVLILALFALTFAILDSKSGDIPREDILRRIEVDEKVRIDDRIIHFDEVIVEKNGDLSIIYNTLLTRDFGSSGYTSGKIGTILDETGQDYFFSSGQGSIGGIFSRGRHTVHGFPEDAEKLIIEYDYYNRYYKVEIPLKSGVAYE